MATLSPLLHPYSRVDRAQRDDEERLIASAISGDSQAFVNLSSPYAARLMSQINRITRNSADAEEVLQEALLRAFVHLKSFEGKASFSTWLTRIAVNCALMRLRQRHAVTVQLDGCSKDGDQTWRAWEPIDSRETPEEDLMRRERQELLNEAILQLRPRLRVVIELEQARGFPLKDIATTLGISVAAVKSRLSRARRTLRGSIQREDAASISMRGAARIQP